MGQRASTWGQGTGGLLWDGHEQGMATGLSPDVPPTVPCSCWLSLEGGLLYAFVGPAAVIVLVSCPREPRTPQNPPGGGVVAAAAAGRGVRASPEPPLPQVNMLVGIIVFNKLMSRDGISDKSKKQRAG